jgi:hypothetical protein
MTNNETKMTSEEQERIMKRQSYLAQQSLDTLDPTKITPLSPEVISRQATINIGKTSTLL